MSGFSPKVLASVGVFHSANHLLELLHNGAIYTKEEVLSINTLAVCPPEHVLELSSCCGWTIIDSHSNVFISSRGHLIVDQQPYWNRLRLQLVDYLETTKPPWLKLAPKGRKEAIQFVPDYTKQVLEEAGLLSDRIDSEIVAWWDSLAQSSRTLQLDRALEIGRHGEEATIIFEYERTGFKPSWHSVESNLSGYDILSRISRKDSTPLRIEVKNQ